MIDSAFFSYARYIQGGCMVGCFFYLAAAW